MVRMNKKCVGWCGWFFLLLLSGAHPIWAQDLVSDRVGATAGQFRVDESGAATYSVPILAVPGTAGVTPQISLNYSSQGGDGPLGRGWSISGLSAISRCRATREAGDFISGGVPVDGTPPAINFTTTDRFCLDGQRLIPAPAGAPACPAVSGFTTSNLRTASEAFQRICAYTPSAASGNGPAFFSVERQDGSTSFYGNRDDWTTSATRPDGYVSSTAATHTAKALSWWQTRFLDSTGNYIDYRYTANPGGGSYPGESLLASIEYTGKKQLAGQSGGNLAPFAKLQFNYAARPATEFARGSVANGVAWQTRYLTSITSIGDIASNQQARFYSLGYGTSSSGSGARTLTSLTECRDSGMSVCLSPTTFAWSNASNSFSSADMVTTAGFSGLVSMRLGDVDGDGLTDVVWFKASGSNSELLVSFGELNASGQLTFNRVPQMSWTLGRSPADVDKYWHLFDYDGDGRDDLFVALPGSNANWVLYPSLGRPTGTGVRAFNLTNNLIATLSPAIPSSATSTILADFNGDGLLDVMYSDSPTGQGLFKTRLTERMGAGFGWGAQRSISMSTTLDPPMVENYQFSSLLDPGQRVHLNDFNGDSRSDLAISTTVTWFKYSPTPGDPCNIIPRPAEAISQWTDESGQVWSEWPASVEQALDPNERIRASCYKITRFVELYGVTNITPTSIQMGVIKQWHVSGEKWPDFPAFSEGYSFKFADFNGDGLTDVMVKNGNWYIDLTGVGTVQSGLALAVDSTTEKFIQLADVNGDGRADIVFPQLTNSNYRPFHGHIARPDGTFPTSASLLSSGNARGCKNATCNLANTYFMFSDFDGDGATDFVAIYDNSADHYSSRAPLASRYQPRDTITHITDGNGALTQLFYRPLTLADVYRRDTGARGVNWGRGSPVQELFGPQYVVVRAQSSAPVYNSTSSMSAVYYRYAGARVQAGGGGMLGFRQIQSIDTTAPGRHIVSTTSYRQDAPFAGVPLETVRRAVVGTYSATACMITTVTNACFQPPGAAFPAIGGTLLAQSTNVWESAPAFVPGTQRPVHIRLAGSDERVHALNNGALTSRVLSSFTHDGYGFATNTSVDTYSGGGSLVARVVTSNTYNHITSPWRLGRLSSSTVTHTRGGSSVSRSTSFTYDTSGAVTGQLLSERIQPGGGANQDLRTFHTLDAFGNRTHTYTCSNHLTEAACKGTAITFQPATATQVHRYARTVYDSRGRFPVASYSPYWNGSNASEYIDSQILARNLFGDVTHARNVNGVDAMATYGTLGRPWYTWTEVVNTSTPGTASAGVESWTTWRRCGTGTNQVPCPTGAVLRQQVITEGAPTQWSYHDVLGRVVLAASQTRHVGTTNKAFSGVCTAYDAAGRPARVSEPFFLTSTAAATEPATFASNVCTTARQWNLTTYDALGRVTALQRADGTGSTVTYSGLTTTTWDANGHATSQTTNALGEVVTSTDAVGLSLSFVYTPDGNIASVSRNAGRGAVTTSYAYDVLGRKTSQTDRDSGTISYQYNAVGEVVSQTDAANHRIDNDLDARGRVWRQRAWRWNGSSHALESTTTHVFDTLVRGALSSDGISGSTGTQSHSYAYDALGRLTQRDSTMDSRTYREQTAYDTLGRAWKSRDASGHWAKQEFDARGFATKTCASTAADTTSTCGSSFYTAVEQVDARGAVTLERRGSSAGPTISRSYNALNGQLVGVCTGTGCTVQNALYDYDNKGQLIRREQAGRYAERFQYDAADRLTLGWFESLGSTYYGTSAPLVDPNTSAPANLSFYAQYDLLGNICRKYGFGLFVQYGYSGRAGCGLNGVGGGGNTTSTQSAHQTASLYVPGVLTLYNGHDVRGNMVDAGGARFYSYSVLNQATSIWRDNINNPSIRSRFAYGSDGQRYRRIDDGSTTGGTTTTTYIGSVERRQLPGGSIQWRRSVAGVVLIEHYGDTLSGGITQASGSGTTRHQFNDHLGSVQVIGSVSGSSITVLERLDTDAHGEWRTPSPPFGQAGSSHTSRGFTGHEHLNGLDTLHMNGRLYWASGGRMVQPDPIITDPLNPQNWNPYSYVLNNPLNLIDPSGYSFLSKYWRTIVAVAISVYTGGASLAALQASNYWAAAGWAAGGGFAAGAIQSNSFNGGVHGAFSGLAFFGVSAGFNHLANVNLAAGTKTMSSTGLTAAQFTGQIVAHGMTGGVLASVQGGKFGHGFASAGFTTGASPMIGQAGGPMAQGTAAALVGGTASTMTGGKFANGAVTAAMSYALSSAASRGASSGEGEWMFPEGGSTDINSYVGEDGTIPIYTNGILGNRGDFRNVLNTEGAPGYFNPSRGPFADLVESFGQKFFGWAGDPLAAGFARGLVGVNHPLTITAHSQGTLTVTNAVRYYGLSVQGSAFVMKSPALSHFTASRAIQGRGGTMVWRQPYGDIANIYAPSLNPLRWASGFGDIFCGACRHTANGLP